MRFLLQRTAQRVGFSALALIVPVAALGQDSELDWLSGCWISDDGRSREVWVIDRDGDLAGFSVTIDDADVSFYEVLTIKRGNRNRWIYSAHPSNQDATAFAASDRGRQRIEFLNASHDFPQVIAYQREDDRLIAVISYLGGADAQEFVKSPCPEGDADQ
ncbi:MAG: DUF6265 family protein [Pseudomonadota bacterium]